MIEAIRWLDNIMLRICGLNDNSFFQLFVFYMIIYVVIAMIQGNIESHMGIEKKVYLFDLIILFILFSFFAYNSYILSVVKVHEGNSYHISKDKKDV